MMNRIFAVLLVLAVVATAPATAQTATLYVADASAVIDISAEGHVEAVVLTGVPGEAARNAYEQQILAWRFEPIVIDGEAVAARAHADLRLLARQSADRGFELTMRDPVFRDPPGSGASGEPAGLRLLERHVPSYPMRSADSGIAAEVTLLIEIAADGSVTRAGVHSATLLGTNATTRNPTGAVRPLVEAGRRSVLEWRFEPSEDNERTALVPINFSFRGSEGTWQAARPVKGAREDWVSAFYAAREDDAIKEFQPERSLRFALLNPPGQDWL